MRKFNHVQNYLITLMGIVLLPFIRNSYTIETTAATPMPTNINAVYSSDAAVNSYYSGVDGLSGDDLVEHYMT
jgi:hypothetical protein